MVVSQSHNFHNFGLNGVAVRDLVAKLAPDFTESRFGAIGTSPGARDPKKNNPLTLIGICRALLYLTTQDFQVGGMAGACQQP